MKRAGTAAGSLLAKAAALLALFPFGSTVQAAPLAIGAIDKVERASITVLGQSIPLASSRVLGDLTRTGALVEGDLVWVEVAHAEAGSLVYTIYLLPEQYAAGSTEIFITGVVSKVTSVGTLTVGDLVVDVNAAVSKHLVDVSVGDTVELFGVQPARNGLVIAEKVSIVEGLEGSAALGVGGSGVLGVGGSGVLGVGGSGLFGVGGSGALGVGGSGILGVGGSGILGVGGSGLLGVGGSGTLGVGGSGLFGVGGSGILGVGGSGLLGVGGSGILGVGGSGLQ